MKRFLSTVLLTLFAVAAQANTGLFFDPERDGEGLLVMRDDALIVGYLYTYEEWCENDYYYIAAPEVGPQVNNDDDVCENDQRWFFFADNWHTTNNLAGGFIFKGVGQNWPDGVTNPANPFGVIVGEAEAIGIYTIRPLLDGYEMRIVPFGDNDPSDPIYFRTFRFGTLLFRPLNLQPTD